MLRVRVCMCGYVLSLLLVARHPIIDTLRSLDARLCLVLPLPVCLRHRLFLIRHQIIFSLRSSLPFAVGQIQDAGLIFLSNMATTIYTALSTQDDTSDAIPEAEKLSTVRSRAGWWTCRP